MATLNPSRCVARAAPFGGRAVLGAAVFVLAGCGADSADGEVPSEQADRMGAPDASVSRQDDTVDVVPPPLQDSGAGQAACSPETIAELEAEIDAILGRLETDTDFTYVIESSGRRYEFSRGDSSLQTEYESASTSKWVTAAIILRLVDAELTVNDQRFGLDSRPADWIEKWPIEESDALSRITLRELLSFTSGLNDAPVCVDTGLLVSFDDCVRLIGERNAENGEQPGAEFHYGSTHMQVAGAMAMRALGVETWTEVFDDFKAGTGLFALASYDLPSQDNPRLAGGMHWTGEQYLEFLRRLREGDVLSPELTQLMLSDRLGDAMVVDAPIDDRVHGDWHYGFGCWIECPSAEFDCTEGYRVSSAGAYGAYPFIDFQSDVIGLVARQGELGTGDDGVLIARSVDPLLRRWASCD